MDPKILDKALALERAGGNPQLADELFGMLMQELPAYGGLLQAALHTQDLEAVRLHAHRLKGSATYCGVTALGVAAETVESHIKRGETGHLAQQVAALITEIDRVLALPAPVY